MRQKIIYCLALIALSLNVAHCQQAFTLEYCIKSALENNVSLQKSRLDSEVSAVSVKQAQGAYQPNISFSTGHNYTHTPFPATGYSYSSESSIEEKNGVKHHSYSGNMGLNLSWTIWNGSRQPQIEQARLNLKRAGLVTNQLENDIREQVARVYTQLLYATENVSVQHTEVESSEALRRQGEERLRLGAINRSTYQQLLSQCATDSAALVQAKADMQTYQLSLLQLMELPAGTEFTLADIGEADYVALQVVPTLDDVYASALEQRPEIKAAQLAIDNADYDTQIAKAGYMPSLSLSAGTGTGWRSGSDFTWGEQMKNGWSNTAGLNLSVPIWNGRQTKSNVEKAKLQQQQTLLEYEVQVKSLRKAVETLWLNALTAQQQYQAAATRLEAAQTSYQLMEQQFSVGSKTATDLMQERATMLNATQQKLQAKYNAYYAQLMLVYYSSGL